MSFFCCGKRLPIYRIGWQVTLQILNEGGRLEASEHSTHVIGPKTGSGITAKGGCVEGYLTPNSVALLKKNYNQPLESDRAKGPPCASV